MEYKNKFFRYNNSLKVLARKNRKNPTKPETIIWNEALRNKFIEYKFIRQKPIGEYILDFYCSKLLLAVEIDGDSHYEKLCRDENRTKYLDKLGIKVLRYQNNEIIENIEGVYLDLKKHIRIREQELFDILSP